MGRKSTIDRMTPEAKAYIQAMLATGSQTLDELIADLQQRFPAEASAGELPSRSALHRYGANTHLTGSLTANFSSRTFHGDLSIGATQIRLGTSGSQIAFDTNGHFDAANAGQWVIPGNVVAATGAVKGDFFGAGAAAVAGIVDFGNPALNIAWGGTKN